MVLYVLFKVCGQPTHYAKIPACEKRREWCSTTSFIRRERLSGQKVKVKGMRSKVSLYCTHRRLAAQNRYGGADLTRGKRKLMVCCGSNRAERRVSMRAFGERELSFFLFFLALLFSWCFCAFQSLMVESLDTFCAQSASRHSQPKASVGEKGIVR